MAGFHLVGTRRCDAQPLPLLAAVHLRGHGRSECHGVAGGPAGQYHDQDGPAQCQSQKGDRKVSVQLDTIQSIMLYLFLKG